MTVPGWGVRNKISAVEGLGAEGQEYLKVRRLAYDLDLSFTQRGIHQQALVRWEVARGIEEMERALGSARRGSERMARYHEHEAVEWLDLALMESRRLGVMRHQQRLEEDPLWMYRV